MNIFKLLVLNLIGPLGRSVNKNVEPAFPSEVGEYCLRNKLSMKKDFNDYDFAVYEKRTGERAIGKLWTGKLPDIALTSLKNEANMYKALGSVAERTKDSTPKIYRNMKIPKLLEEVKGESYYLLLIEYIRNQGLNQGEKEDVLLKIRDYLKLLGKNMNDEEKKLVGRRDQLQIAILYPLLLTTALFRNIRLTKKIIKTIPMFIKSLPGILDRKEVTLGHRDLKLQNVLKSGDKYYLTDMQYSLFTDEIYDHLSTVRVNYDDKEVRRKMIDELNLRNFSDKDKTAIQGMLIIGALHGVCGHNLPKWVRKDAREFLEDAVEGKILNFVL